MLERDIKIIIADHGNSLIESAKEIFCNLKSTKIYYASSSKEVFNILIENHIDIIFINDINNNKGHIESNNKTPLNPRINNFINSVTDILGSSGRDYVIKGNIGMTIAPMVISSYRRGLAQGMGLRQQMHIYCISNMCLPGIIGQSRQMQSLSGMIWRVSQSCRPVLIIGPSGSGKELVADAIHKLGPTSGQRFLDVNCGAIPEHLLEAQCFGYERGAFTGADRRNDGFFHIANNGTLFLDEVAELPISIQAKLLRVLESGTFRRLGSSGDCLFNGRIIAATHANLERQVRRNAFREDLLFRLNVLTLKVPPLNERREDISDLIAHFSRGQPRTLVFTDKALRILIHRDWPGNVRELRNFVDRIAILTDDDPITEKTVLEMLSEEPISVTRELDQHADSILSMDLDDKLEAIQNALVNRALAVSEGNKSAAARLLGVHRKVIERRISAKESTDVFISHSPSGQCH